ncbi:MAG TPA: serine/threonine-protein kinase [Solirubrobacteraceae bacterium]|jgi:serine/threonine-protein kinase|nr:serine/threonine-protein kinase [Solirubrobacteraceae bacterium]
MPPTAGPTPVLPGYRLQEVIGRGGMGTVYRAWHVGLGRAVAVKTIAAELSGDPALRARFLRESRLAASLEHPNAVPVYDAGEHDDCPYIAMKLVTGTNLQALIREHGALPPRCALDILTQVARALDAAHAAGLVHRDVKPSNILLEGGAAGQRPASRPPRPSPSEGTEPWHAYLSDFGLAFSELADESLTSTGSWLGTLDYAAPEQIRGKPIDGRSDVYALGCVLFAALAGRPPFAGVPAAAKAAAQAHEPPPTLEQAGARVPAALQRVLDRALAKDPAARYATAGALMAAAQAAEDAPDDGDDTAETPETAEAAQRSQEDVTRRRPRRAPQASAPVTASTERLTSTRRIPAWAPALILLAAIGIALAALLIHDHHHSHHAKTTVRRTASRPRVKPPPAIPAAAPDGDTVRCSGSSCTQDGHVVVAPIQGSSCTIAGATGQWVRIDAGLPEPMLTCEPARGPPSGAGPRVAAVPDLAGARLDRAERALDRLGVPYDTSGGGLFGIIITSNWVVCTTTPAAGTPLSGGVQVRLFVDRSC